MNDWSGPRWRNLASLLAAMDARADAGRTVVLSPETTRMLLEQFNVPRRPGGAWDIDLYSQGSCVYHLDQRGEVMRVDAWARSSLVAQAARLELVRARPNDRFTQRRRGFIEG